MKLATRVTAITTAALLGGALTVAAAPAASAGVEKTSKGSCTKSSTWKLDLEKEHGVIDIDFEGKTSASGKTWNYKVKQNGVVRHSGKTVTERDGEFDIDRNVKDRAGKDTIIVRAKHSATGEVCKAKLSI